MLAFVEEDSKKRKSQEEEEEVDTWWICCPGAPNTFNIIIYISCLVSHDLYIYPECLVFLFPFSWGDKWMLYGIDSQTEYNIREEYKENSHSLARVFFGILETNTRLLIILIQE